MYTNYTQSTTVYTTDTEIGSISDCTKLYYTHTNTCETNVITRLCNRDHEPNLQNNLRKDELRKSLQQSLTLWIQHKIGKEI